jgi:hypothetical protein
MMAESKIAAVAITTGATGIFATGSISAIDFGWMRPLVEFGSFGIIAFAAVYILMKVAPAFITHLDRARDAFISELREERMMRQKNFDVLTEDLHRIDKSIQSLERSVTQHLNK